MAKKVPVCVSVGKGRCERAAGEQVLYPLVSCYMLERVCHRWIWAVRRECPSGSP